MIDWTLKFTKAPNSQLNSLSSMIAEYDVISLNKNANRKYGP